VGAVNPPRRHSRLGYTRTDGAADYHLIYNAELLSWVFLWSECGELIGVSRPRRRAVARTLRRGDWERIGVPS
jgi:hypothetical protein